MADNTKTSSAPFSADILAQCIAMNQAFSLPGHPFKLGWDYICRSVCIHLLVCFPIPYYECFIAVPSFYATTGQKESDRTRRQIRERYRRSEKLEEAKKEVAAAEALVELASGSRG